MPKTKAPVPKNETKKARFKRLASTRLNNALNEMRRIALLATNPQRYDFTESQARQIIDALDKGVETVETALYAYTDRKGSRAKAKIK